MDTTAAVPGSAFRACVEEAAADDGVDALLAVAVPTAVSDVRAAVIEAAVSKPLAVVLLDQAESVKLLSQPASAQPVRAAEAPPVVLPGGPTPPARRQEPYGQPSPGFRRTPSLRAPPARWATRPGTVPGATGSWASVPELTGLRTDDARSLIRRFLAGHGDGGWLPADQAAELLSCYQIPLITTLTAGSEEEAVAAAARLGGRVVLKAEAEGLVHKSDAGAVKLDLRTPQEVASAYGALAASLGARLRRVLVQPMIADGVEGSSAWCRSRCSGR